MLKNLLCILLFVLTTNAAVAGNTTIAQVYVKEVIYVAVGFGSHQAGNLEVKLTEPFSTSDVSCDANYITTLGANDPDGRLFSLFLAAKASNQPLNINITDAVHLTAFAGRCSVRWASIVGQ